MKKTLLFSLAIVMLFTFSIPAEGKTVSSESLCFHATVKSRKQIKLTWKKQSVTKYKIYRTEVKVKKTSGEYVEGKYQLIATVSGKKTSYTDKRVKANKHYAYQIAVYKKKKSKLKRVFLENVYAYTGNKTPEWEEYAYCDTQTTPKGIPLTFQTGPDSLHPDGVIFYKKTNGRYQKIKTVKLKKNQYRYTYLDTEVKTGQKYYYKLRTYKTINGKKTYSKYSPSLKQYAVNHTGKYTISFLTDGGARVPSAVIGLTSDSGNATATILDFVEYCYELPNADTEFPDVYISAYSFDNQNWIPFKDSISIKAGATVYLKLEAANDDTFYLAGADDKDSVFTLNVTYAELPYLLKIDTLHGSAQAEANGEMTH